MGAWLLTHPIIIFSRMVLDVFSITLCTRLGFPHPLVLKMSYCICSQPLDPMGIPLVQCVHGGERMASHGVVWNAFEVITRDEKFHVSWKHTHVLQCFALQSLHRRINIVLSIDGVRMLAYIIIIDPTSDDLVLRATFSYKVIVIVATQVKDALCHDRFLMDMFLPLVVEDFRCLHQEANGFLHRYANMARAMKGTKGPLLSVLHAFYRQKVLVLLQHA